MSDHVTQYKKELKKNLRCSSNVKKRLMGKFDCSLSTFLDDKPTPDIDELCTAFGSPKEMASVLMEEVTPEEAARYRKNTIIARIVAGATAGTILFLIVAISVQIYFYKEQDVVIENEIIVIEDDSSPAD